MIPQRIVILGGTGFVGSRLLPRLHADGHQLTVLTRHPQQHRDLAVLPGLALRRTDVHDAAALQRALAGSDAVINLVGILNEQGRQTFQRVHIDLARTLIDACREAGVQRLHQMSSLKAGQGLSQYLKSRGDAETLVRQSSLTWTIYQPSVIFGEGDGLVSRFNGLLKIAPILPLARTKSRLAPTWVGDVAEAIARCMGDNRAARNKVFELYGPEVLTLGQIVRAIRDAGGRRNVVIPLPDSLGRLQAQIAGRLPGKPFSLDNFRSLRTDSVGKVDGYATLGIAPRAFTPALPRLLGRPLRQQRMDEARKLRG